MKIAYIYHWNEGSKSSVRKKIQSQISQWVADGHDVKQFMVCQEGSHASKDNEGIHTFVYRNSRGRLSIWDSLYEEVKLFSPNFLYFRYDLLTPGIYKLLRKFPTFTEINTNDIEEFKIYGKGRQIYNLLTRRVIFNRSSGLIFTSFELSNSRDFFSKGTSSAVISNGLDLDKTETLSPSNNNRIRISIIGSKNQPWQGFDKINTLAKMLPCIDFDVIGATPQEAGVVPYENVKFHGQLTPDLYLPILQQSTAAFGTIALHRKNMDEASPLKVRECLALGIPVINGYKDTDFPNGADFILQLKNTEDNLVEASDKIREFAEKWKGRRVNRSDIQHLSFKAKEMERLKFMRSNYKGKIIVLTTGLNIGGAEQQVVSLSKELKRRGWKVVVVSMIKPKHFVSILADSDIPVLCLNMNPGKPSFRALWRWLRVIISEKPQVIHSHMIHANLLGRMSRIVSKKLIIISTAHNTNEGGGWRNLAYRFTDPAASLTTHVSFKGAKDYLRKGLVSKDRILTISNGIDTSLVKRDPIIREKLREDLGVSSGFVWMSIGRLVEAKNHLLLVEAFKRVNETDPSSKLILIGDGPLKTDIESKINRLNLSKHVIMLGSRTDAIDLLNAADGYVMSSAWEGFPISLLEAASMSLPIVSTNVGDIEEILKGSELNKLIPPNKCAILAKSMLEIMAYSPNVVEQVGKNNRLFVIDNFDISTTVDKWERIYLKLLDREL